MLGKSLALISQWLLLILINHIHSGKFNELCVEIPPYDWIIGNVDRARDANNPNENWKAIYLRSYYTDPREEDEGNHSIESSRNHRNCCNKLKQTY